MPWIHMAPISVGLLKVVWSVNARPPTLSKKAKEKRRYNIGIFFLEYGYHHVFQSRAAKQGPRTPVSRACLTLGRTGAEQRGERQHVFSIALFFADKSLTSRFKHCDSKPLALERGCCSKPGKSSTNNDNARLGLLAANAGGDCGEGEEQGRVMHWIYYN